MLAREKDLLVSAVCSFSAAMCLFCQISNFHDTILAVDSEKPCQRNQDYEEEKKERRQRCLVFKLRQRSHILIQSQFSSVFVVVVFLERAVNNTEEYLPKTHSKRHERA